MKKQDHELKQHLLVLYSLKTQTHIIIEIPMPITNHHFPSTYVLSGTPKKTVSAIADFFINVLIVRAIILNAVFFSALPHRAPITLTQLRLA